ncbi:MAG TPA: hypothetical protein VEW93_10245 [Acidimicrobiales bacterium]|nr:hypothetical protein [Acidimicrobiales bacterium]
MRRRLALAAVPLVLTSLLLAGCGDDGDDASPTTTTETASTTLPDGRTTTTGEPDTTEDGATTESTGTTESTTTTEGDGGNQGGDDFCAGFADLNELFRLSPDETLEDLQAGTVDFAAAAADLVEIAPGEIADDMQVMADFFADLSEAVADATSKDEAESIAGELRSPELDTAGQAVSTWTNENCPEAG